jgi:hypothetical protein
MKAAFFLNMKEFVKKINSKLKFKNEVILKGFNCHKWEFFKKHLLYFYNWSSVHIHIFGFHHVTKKYKMMIKDLYFVSGL